MLVVAPMMSGKTTLTNDYPDVVIDIDDALANSSHDWSEIHSIYASKGEWTSINNVYGDVVQKLIKEEPDKFIMVHSPPEAYGIESEFVMIDELPETEFMKRLHERIDIIPVDDVANHIDMAFQNRAGHAWYLERNREKVVSMEELRSMVEEVSSMEKKVYDEAWRVLLKVDSGSNAIVYVKISFELDKVKSWETYNSRMPESYWQEGYGTTEPDVLEVEQSVYFRLTERFDKVNYLCIWVVDGIVMTEPVGEKPTEQGIQSGFEILF